MNPQITIKQRKNQVFIQIKEDKRTGTYKYNPDIPLDIYYQYFKNKSKKLGSIKKYQEHFLEQPKKPDKKLTTLVKNYYKKFNIKRPRIQNIIKKGISKTYIPNIAHVTEQQLRTAYKDLLGKLVIDKQLLNILATEENIKKLQSRLEYKYTIIGTNIYTKKDTIIGTITHIGKKTPRQTINEIKNEPLLKKPIIDTEITGYGTNKIQQLKNKGYQYSHMNNGTPRKISLTIIFRKGV